MGVLMRDCTTTSERIDHWTKMRRLLAKFSKSEASNHTPFSADFTTTTPELKFSVHTGARIAAARRVALLPKLLGKVSADHHVADAATRCG
jgi:hypothetical protein